MHQQNPANSTLVYSTCGSTAQCRKKCALIFFTLMFLLVGFILIIVGISAKRSWGPEDELRSSFCKEERMATEQNLKNCRIVGPIFLAIGFFFLSATIIVLTSKPRENRAEYVIGRPNTGQIGSATHGGSDNVTTPSQHPQHPQHPSPSWHSTALRAFRASLGIGFLSFTTRWTCDLSNGSSLSFIFLVLL